MSEFDSDDEVKLSKMSVIDIDTKYFDLPSSSTVNMPLNSSTIKRLVSPTDYLSKTESSLPLILTSEYFIIVDQRINTKHQKLSNGVLALCQVCQKKISGSTKVTSNFLKHTKTKHPALYQKYLRQKSRSHCHPRARKFQIQNQNQSNFDEKVLKFVISSCLPLSIVENSSFLALFQGTNLNIKSSRYLSDLLDTKFEQMVQGIEAAISKIENICCAAKVWTDQRISFLGYTCHWIDSRYERRSEALALRRLGGPQTNHKIADIINEVNNRFGITVKKLVCTVIDDDDYYIKEEFGNHYEGSCEEDVKFDPSAVVFQVSKHVECASHALNLLATVDLLEALEKIPQTFEKHQRSMQKCSLIWNKCNKAEFVKPLEEILSTPLMTPVVIRLNSLYEAIKQLLSLSLKLNEITNVLSLAKFERSEIEYLEEYCQFMQPIAEGLDFLQKEENIYFGYLAPTLLTLKAKLHKLASSTTAVYLTSVAKHMEDALVDRFRPFFEMQPSSHDAVIAAMTCPTVKLMNCVKLIKIWKETAPNCTASALQDIFVNEVISNSPRTDTRLDKRKNPELTAHPFFILEDSEEDDLLQLQTDRNREGAHIIEELRNFLENGESSMDSLHNYPLIKRMFYKYNTGLPSSTPVERLYSFGEMINEYRCQKLTDEVFEKMVLVQNNKVI